MPSLKDLKNKIASVKNTRKITKAMQMVSAAKLRRAQEAAEAARPYADRMASVVGGLAASVSGSATAPKLLSGTGSDQVHLMVVMTSERGLCGGFNTNIVRLARQHAFDLIKAGKTVKKGREQLRRDLGDKMVGHVDMSAVKRLSYADAQNVARDVLARFEAGECDVVTIFYNRFQSVISQVPTALQVIPAKFDATPNNAQYDYEPSEEGILADLLPRAVATQVFTALLENGASEQGARMSAMDNATRNAGEMITKYTTIYNRSRQAAITKELIEIISGAEAL